MIQDLTNILVELENIKSQNVDLEDKSLITYYQIVLSNYEALMALKNNPVFNSLIEAFTHEIGRIEDRLKSDRDLLLSPDKREEVMYLLAKKDVLTDFVAVYTDEPSDPVNYIVQRINKFKSNK
jgi:hypothetical protein